jgi:prevent-host-death family protein
MKVANIAELKNHLSDYLRLVENGEVIEVAKRNVPFARIVPLPKKPHNQTRLGALMGSVTVKCDLTQPAMPEDDWDMLKE